MNRAIGLLVLLWVLAAVPLQEPEAGDIAQAAVPSSGDKGDRPRLVVQTGHSSVINSLAWSPNGQTLASVDYQTLKLWHVATGLQLRTETGGSLVTISPTGHMLAFELNKTIELRDLATGQPIRTLAGHSGLIESLAFSRDGRILASGGADKSIKLWDVTTGEELRTLVGHEGAVERLAFSADGQRLASASAPPPVFSQDGLPLLLPDRGGAVKLWDLASGSILYTLPIHAHSRSINPIAFSPDGQTLASCDSHTLWDIVNRRELCALSARGCGFTAFTPDGRLLITAQGSFEGFGQEEIQDGELDIEAEIWDIKTCHMLSHFHGHANKQSGVPNLMDIFVSPDGRTIASTGGGQNIQIWNVETGQEIETLTGYQDSPASVAVSPDGRTLAIGASTEMEKMEGGVIHLWNLATGRLERTLRGHRKPVSMLAFSPNGKMLVSACYDRGYEDTSVKLWDLATGRVRYTGHHDDRVSAVAFSPDGRTFASGDHNRLVKLWDAKTGRERRTFTGSDGWVTSVAISPDGLMLATAGVTDQSRRHFSFSAAVGRNPLIRDLKTQNPRPGSETEDGIWLLDIATGMKLRVLRGHTGQINMIIFSSDGRTLASASLDGTVKLWDVTTGRNLRTLRNHDSRDPQWVSNLALSPDGGTIASANSDGTIKLWDLETGKELMTLSGHTDAVAGEAFVPDGKTLVSASYDGTSRLWRVADGAHLATLIALRDGGWVVTDPDGRFDTADLERIKGVHWVMPNDPLTPVPIEAFMKAYYEPQLLPRILGGEHFKPVASLTALNPVQPLIKLNAVQREGNSDMATVTLEVEKGAREILRDDQPVTVTTGVHDVKLFRDGQLVGFEEGAVRLDPSGKAVLTFKGIRLPRQKGIKETEFSAYAFNDDGVKSQTSRTRFAIPPDLTPAKGRAYLITVGVDRYQNAAWNLRYAASDALRIRQALETRLPRAGGYADLVAITLTDEQATKENLKALFDRLAGHPGTGEQPQIPNAEHLAKTTPEDLLILSFSGHGYVDERGVFYSFTHDIGPGDGKGITPELLAHAVSSDELSRWLRDVDAGEMAMIIDACHSAATVGAGFKPGPMGSRGLGQLAYDKGMRILAATQADDVALESDRLQQGLLTYGLVHDGLDAFQADFKPEDGAITLAEWLAYGVARVPALYAEIGRGTLASFGRGDAHRGTVVYWGDQPQGTSARQTFYQTPALFDFTRKQKPEVRVAVAPGRVAPKPVAALKSDKRSKR